MTAKKHTVALAIFLLSCIHIHSIGNIRNYTVSDGLPTNQIQQIIQLPNRQMLVATEGGVCLFNGKMFVEQPCNLDSVMPLPHFGGDGHLWQGDSILWLKDFYSLYIYNVRERKFQYDYEPRVGAAEVRHFVSENGDSLITATIRRNDRLRLHFDSIVRGTPLEGAWMQTVCRDRQGGLWMGTRQQGILYERPPHPMATLVQLPDGDVPLKLAEADSGKLIVGALRGIYLYDCAGESIDAVLARGDISCSDISKDVLGRVWISTAQGLYCYNHGTLDLISGHNTTGLLHSKIRFSLPLPDGRLLVCNLQNQLGLLNLETHHFDRLNEKIPELESYRTMVAAHVLDRPDLIAVCTQNGIFVLDVAQTRIRQIEELKSTSRYSHKFNCIFRDRKGRLWLGTPAGLLCLLPEGERHSLRRFTKADGLPNNAIQSITEDQNGDIWMGTAMGVCRVNMNSEGTVSALNLWTSDGLPPIELTERGICSTSDGYVYFTSDEGLIALNAADFSTTLPVQDVEIVGLQAAGKQLPSTLGDYTLNYRENDITIQFSALNYAAPEATRYRFRLLGAEPEWNYESGKEGLLSVTYFALQPAEYRFEVQAQVGVGEWGPLTTLRFTIHPPFWLTWWAKSVYAIVILSLLLLAVHIYIRRRNCKLERSNEERINRLFELRDEARHQFALSAGIDLSKVSPGVSEEEELTARLMKAISNNLDNQDYTVDMLASDVAMSRANLYKKTSTMLGITPNDFIRNVRLKRAESLLGDTKLSVSQISLMVGFGSPRYFSQCFRQMYGCTPSEYREGK